MPLLSLAGLSLLAALVCDEVRRGAEPNHRPWVLRIMRWQRHLLASGRTPLGHFRCFVQSFEQPCVDDALRPECTPHLAVDLTQAEVAAITGDKHVPARRDR